MKEKPPDIIALSEVKAKNQRKEWNTRSYIIPGYNMEENIKEEGRGMLMYIKDHLDYTIMDKGKEISEAQVAKILLEKGQQIILVSVYRSPNSNQENNKKINDFIRDICKESKNIIIAGDTNYPGINWDNMTGMKEEEFEFIEAVRDGFLIQHVNQPTRGRGTNNPSLLDIILTKEHSSLPTIKHKQPIGKSDHSVLSITIDIHQSEKYEKTKLNINRGNYDRMRELLSNIDWEEELERKETVEEKWDIFREIMENTMERCIPKLKIKRKLLKNVPVNNKTLSKIRRKKRLWKQYLDSGNQRTYLKYCRARNQVRQLTRKNMKELEKKIAQEAKTNPKKFWAYAGQKTKNRETIPQLSMTGTPQDGRLTKNNQEKAETLASFFNSVFSEEPTDHWTLPPSTSPPIDQDIIINEEITYDLLSQLNRTKSPGPDGLHPRVLFETKEAIAKPLSIIYQHSLAQGELPSIWKVANITAIHKKGDKRIAGNYRPVSLTSIPCKIMEKIIRKKIMDHLITNRILSNKQYGFITGRSTLIQLLKVLDQWTEALDRGTEIDVIFLDFKKAFDRVPHQRLIDKLKFYGINGQILTWITAFLQNRKQRVSIHEATSQWAEVKSGIPQGSVLGPTLFIIFINSLPDTTISPLFLFADDAKIFREITSATDQQTLQDDINNLYKWTQDSLLTFNLEKCTSMTISRSGNNVRQYSLNNSPLNSTSKERDLGVILDNRLHFDQHIQAKINKANSIMALIRKTYTYLDNSSFLLLFKSLVRPHLEYANQIWKPYLKKHITAIENVQRRATRLLPGMQDLSYEERLQKLKLPTLQYRRTRGDLIETYKIASGHYDTQVTENFLLFNNRTSRGHSMKIHHQRYNTNLRKNSFTVRIAQLWNSLPTGIVTAPSITSFERRLDGHLITIPELHPYRPP